MKKLTENDLHEMGLMIDPNDQSKAVRIDDTENAAPDESWEPERLTAYALSGLDRAKKLENAANLAARRSTVQLFRAGHALTLLRSKLKGERGWCDWQEAHNIPRTTAWEAIQLYAQAKTEEAIAKLTLTEAKKRFGVTKPPRSRSKATRRSKPVEAGPALRLAERVSQETPDVEEQPDGWNDGGRPPRDDAPPPKEDPASPLLALTRIASFLTLLTERTTSDRWHKEDRSAIREKLDAIVAIVNGIRKEVSHAA